MINYTVCSAINHLLEGEDWARARLKAHAGKFTLIEAANLEFCFKILSSGLLAPAQPVPGVEPALRIALPLGSLVASARGDEGALKSVDVHGDADLAQAVLFLVGNLRWDVGEDLARVLGDIVAHRMVEDARGLMAWERDARTRLARSAGEYLTTEAEILAATAPLSAFGAAVDHLRDDTARLDKRIAAIAAGKTRKRAG